MSLQVQGVLHAKFDTQDVSASFKKRDFVLMVSDNPQYPQYVLFQLTQEKCVLLDSFQMGITIEVNFNLRGRAWTSPQGETKYFNTLEAWKLNSVGATQTSAAPSAPVAPAPIDLAKTSDSDDMPF